MSAGGYNGGGKVAGSGGLSKVKAIAQNAMLRPEEKKAGGANQAQPLEAGAGANPPAAPEAVGALSPQAAEPGTKWIFYKEGHRHFEDSVSSFGEVDHADDTFSTYHFLGVKGGTLVSIWGERLETDFDMNMWVFEGHMTYQDFIDGGYTTGNRFKAAFAGSNMYDDQIWHESGPHGDPAAQIVSPESGRLTVVVTNYASDPDDGGDDRFDYLLHVEGTFAQAGDTGVGSVGYPFWGWSELPG